MSAENAEKIMKQLYNQFKGSNVDYYISEDGEYTIIQFSNLKLHFRISIVKCQITGKFCVNSNISGAMFPRPNTEIGNYESGEQIMKTFRNLDEAIKTGELVHKGMGFEIRTETGMQRLENGDLLKYVPSIE